MAEMVKVRVYNPAINGDDWIVMSYNAFLSWRYGHSYFEVIYM